MSLTTLRSALAFNLNENSVRFAILSEIGTIFRGEIGTKAVLVKRMLYTIATLEILQQMQSSNICCYHNKLVSVILIISYVFFSNVDV